MIGLTNVLQMTKKDFFERDVNYIIGIIDSFIIEEENVERIKDLYKESDKDKWWTFFIPAKSCSYNVIKEINRLYQLHWTRNNLEIKISSGEREISSDKMVYGVYFELHRKPY